MRFKDKFNSVTQLIRHKVAGEDYRIDVRPVAESRVSVVAPHGGYIDFFTGDIATAVAANDHNLYIFNGLQSQGNMGELHVTSIHFDEPSCLDLVAKTDKTVTIHGCVGDTPAVYLSGRDKALQSKLAAAFNAAGLPAKTEGHIYTTGNMPENVCNKNSRGEGVQIEMTLAIRKDPVLRQKAVAAIRAALQ